MRIHGSVLVFVALVLVSQAGGVAAGAPATVAGSGPTDVGARGPPTDVGVRGPPTDVGARGPPTDVGVRGPPTDIGARGPPTDVEAEMCDPSYDGAWAANGTEYVLCLVARSRVNESIVGVKEIAGYVRTDQRVFVPSATRLPEYSYNALEPGSLRETTVQAINRTTLGVDWNLTVSGAYRRGFADGANLYLTTDSHLYSVVRETGEVVWKKELAAEPVGDERHLVGVDKVDNLLHVEFRNGEQPNRYLVVDARTGETVLSASGDEHIDFVATVPGAALFETPDRLVKMDTATLEVVNETPLIYNDNNVHAEHADSDTLVYTTPEHIVFVDARTFEIHTADVGGPGMVLAHRLDVRGDRLVLPMRDIGSYTRTERFRTDPTGPMVTRTEEAFIRTYSMDGRLLEEERFPESDLEAFRTRLDEEFPSVQHQRMIEGVQYKDLEYDYRRSVPNRAYTRVDGSRVLAFREIRRNTTIERRIGDHTLNYTSYGGSLRGEVRDETLSIHTPGGERVYNRSMPKYSDFVGYGGRSMLVVTDSPNGNSVIYEPTILENEPPEIAAITRVSDGTGGGVAVTTTDQSPSDLQSIEIRIRNRTAGGDGAGTVGEPGVVLERDGDAGFEVYSYGLPSGVRTNVTDGSVTVFVPYAGAGPRNVSVVSTDRHFESTGHETVVFESAATPQTSTGTDERTGSGGDGAAGRPSSPVPFPVGALGSALVVVAVAVLVSRRDR